jgi:uncharacterized phiE125 gp8 family phage protein
MGLRLITPPAIEPVTLQEAKDHLRINTTDNDAKINMIIRSAREYVETFLSRALIEQTWDFYIDSFPIDGDIQIPKPPLIAVNSLSYFDPQGVQTLVDPADYYVDNVSEPGWIVRAGGFSWPTTLAAINAVVVRFRGGYVTADSPPQPAVPFDIKAAILLTIGAQYEHREDVVLTQTALPLPQGCLELLIRHRIDLGYW